MAGTGVQLGVTGGLEVVRQAPPEDPDRLRATIDRLRRAAGTGAVEILRAIDDGDRVELAVAYAGQEPAGPLAGDAAGRFGSAAAAALADLHARGIVHGHLRAEHVLVDASGRVRLCGLGPDDDGASAADDVLALGRLLESVLDTADASAAARAVAVAVDRCCATDAAARPTAGALAASLATTAPEARLIRRAPVISRPRLPRPIVAIVVAAVAAVAAVGAVVAGALEARDRRSPTSATTTTIAPRPTTGTTPVAHRVHATRVWPAGAPHVLDAHGRWTFGTDDDRVFVADWDCDGVDTAALVQPDGDVYVLDGWLDGATARFVMTVEGVTDASVETGATCDALVVRAGVRVVRPALAGS